jgi:anti-anti-sigma factor
MAKTFHTTIENRMGHIWITFVDSVDMDNYQKIEDNIFHQIKKNDLRDIVVDLSKTSTLFSSGLGVLMRLHSFASENKKEVFLVNVSTKLNEVLKFSSLDRVMKVFPTVEEFEAFLKKNP